MEFFTGTENSHEIELNSNTAKNPIWSILENISIEKEKIAFINDVVEYWDGVNLNEKKHSCLTFWISANISANAIQLN